MTTDTHSARIPDRWSDEHCAGFSEPELLRYRSNLLGADKRITNFGGGNTSAKVKTRDPLTGTEVDVLWVKGSGGDLGSIGLDGFATLYLDKLESLKRLYRGEAHEDEMVGYLPHCTFDLNPRAGSIDTPLHAFIPHRHVDHTHPDALIAIAAASDSESLTRRVFGERIGWLPWKRPGFELGLWLERKVRENPALEGLVLGGHGLFTWGDTARSCYVKTLEVIQQATDYLAEHCPAITLGGAFGGEIAAPQSAEQRRTFVAQLMPRLRGKLSRDNPKIGHFDDSSAVLEFVGSKRARELAELGTSCPDHFLRTKIKPLFVGFDPTHDTAETVATRLDALLQGYSDDYRAYYERCKRPDSPPMRDAYPVVILIPTIGMLTFAKDKATARVSAEFYVNAINVMRGATGVSDYVGLPEQEAFDIEYWALEEAKLQRMPKPKSLAGRVAIITGGAGGIGKATARRLLADGACIVATDVDAAGLEAVARELGADFGSDAVRTVVADVTDEDAVLAAYEHAFLEYGGVDICVSNAGIASAAPIDETTMAVWSKNMDILATGYFLVAREAFRAMKAQALEGSIVFVASKNALAASPNAAAYCTAKAAEVHLARCLALEGAPHGIRVNVVNPDAVLTGSKIWTGDWRKERAEAYGLAEDELEEHYRNRSLLGKNVLPEDVAEAVYFFAASLSAKSTGNILNVDAGNAASFTR